MSLADQIGALEDELNDAQHQCESYEATIRQMSSDIDDLETENWELADFIEFVDKTSPELRTAYEAAKILNGDKP